MSKRVICLFVTLFPAAVFAMTVEQLREQVTKNLHPIEQMHAVYVAEDNDYSQARKLSSAFTKLSKELEKAGQSPSNIDTIKTVIGINGSRKEKIECFVDIDTGDAKEITTDLRDISKLLKENNLPDKEKMNVCQSKALLKNHEYHLSLAPADNFSDNIALMVLEKNDPNYVFISHIRSLGQFPSYYLTDAYDITLSEQADGKLEIDAINRKHKEYTTIILCDPSLDYHVTSIKQYKDKILTKEMSFTGYRTIDRIPFPFRYSEKSFDEDGNITDEKTYTIEQVEFNQEFAPDTFKVTIPVGTYFHDFAFSNVMYDLDEGGFWSMEDLLAVATKNAEKYKNPTKSNCSRQNP